MIDNHTHILPGLDDGAHDLEEALGMLRMAASAGTTDMVATSHSNPLFVFDPQVAEEKLAELQWAAGGSIRLHFGCELHMTLEGIENALRSPELYSIGHQGHILVEFSDFQVPKTTSGILGQMIDRGLHPIIAHPERNPILRARMSELEAWVERGCSMRVTSQSLLGRFGKSAKAASQQLMERGLVTSWRVMLMISSTARPCWMRLGGMWKIPSTRKRRTGCCWRIHRQFWKVARSLPVAGYGPETGMVFALMRRERTAVDTNRRPARTSVAVPDINPSSPLN